MIIRSLYIIIAVLITAGIGGLIAFVAYYGFQGKPISIREKDYTLKGRLYGKTDSEHLRPAILFLPGWNPGKQPWTYWDFYAGFFSKKMDIICLTVALRGMGSAGNINTLTRADFLNDVTAAYDFLTNLEGVDCKRISVLGESFGAYMASLLSLKRPIQKLALRVPTDFPTEGFADTPHIQFVGQLSREWKMSPHAFTKSPALEAVHAFHGNMLLVASERDNIVPFQTTENYLSAISDSNRLEYVLMKGTGHALFNPMKQFEFLRILSGWLYQ